MKKIVVSSVLPLVVAISTGCVSQGRYDEAVAQTNTTRAELAKKNVALEQVTADLDQRREEITKLHTQIDDLSKTSTSSGTRISELQKRLIELEAAQSAALSRAALYRELSLKLKKQIDAGDLAIVIRDGRMVLQLPNDVLFDTGKTELKPAGEAALQAVAEVMASMPSRQFQIAGHTDSVPIHNEKFASNWELSSGRALRVVHFLIGQHVNASSLSAAGYGEVDPVGPNDTPDGKKRNRRTEITLQPNIDELVKVP